MNGALATWGPSLLIWLTVIFGILYNSRLNGLRSHMEDCFDDADKRFNALDKSFDDLKDFIKSEFRRLEDQQSPIHRG